MGGAEFNPRLDILPASQRLLWRELVDVPSYFTLYGGTAVTLHLGHRTSIDFDFFGFKEIDPGELCLNVSFLRDSKVIQQEKNTLSCLVDRTEPVKVSFFGLPHMRRVECATVTSDIGLKIASLLDLAGTKALVVQQRAELKDYVDINAMLGAGLTLADALAAAQVIFGASFNPQITLKALSYFDDGDVPELPAQARRRILDAVKSVDLSALPHFHEVSA